MTMTRSRPLPLLDEATPSYSVADGHEDDAGFGALETARGRLPLAALDVSGRIDGLLSQVTVRQTFVNATDEPLEATYIFPLPDRAGGDGLSHGGGRARGRGGAQGAWRRRAGIIRRRFARGTAHRSPRKSARGCFSLRVGNLMPGDVATVQLTMVGILPYHDGEVTFRFPLVVAPALYTGSAARRTVGRRRNGRRYECRARRLADLAAGIAPRVSQPGAAVAGDRCPRAGGRPARQPVHGLWGRSRRRAAADPATGRAARPRFHPAVPAGRRSTVRRR